MNIKEHWETIYSKKSPKEVSWYQAYPKKSLELIASLSIRKDSNIIDVGGGASVLVDELVNDGFSSITVLDISSAAIQMAQSRLGDLSSKVNWIERNITEFQALNKYDLWHDRAVFHFLTDEEDRKKYIDALNRTLASEGHLIIAGFAIDGPTKCSGLDVVRYSPESLCCEIAPGFELIETFNEFHMTPSSKEQKFVYCLFKKCLNK